ncbi:MAG TPA: methyltransferase domain-containing protein [Ktedonobacterales bacterium]|jgi:SAM-dependent methyltransferase|nr:methyltransferase domain-containing protein [Ktedonobacterales bacterium]
MSEDGDSYIGRDDPAEGQRLAAQRMGGLDELRGGLALCALPARPRVLEIGCGAGSFTLALLEALPEARIVACDLNENLLAQARAAVSPLAGAGARVRFERADAARLPYAPRSFDLVACRCVLMHQADPAVVAGEMHRVAALDGYALAVEPDWGARATYPDAEALQALLDLGRAGHPYGFPDLLMGRKLFALLRAMGFGPVWLRPSAFAATADDALAAPEADPRTDAAATESTRARGGPEGLLIQGRRILRSAGLASDAELDALIARLVAARRSPDYCVAGLDLVAVGHKPAPALPG